RILASLATANAGMQSGKLRTLAVTTRERVPRLPDVPTIHESGVPGYDVATWIGAFAPAGTAKAVIDKIEGGIKQALAAPDVRAKLEALSMEIRSGAAEEMRAVLAGDSGQGAQHPDRAVRRPRTTRRSAWSSSSRHRRARGSSARWRCGQENAPPAG